MKTQTFDYKGKMFKITPHKKMAGICVVSAINTLDTNKDTHEVFYLCDEEMSQEVLEAVMNSILTKLERGPLSNDVWYKSKAEHSPAHSYLRE